MDASFRLARLKDRAQMLQRSRAFFAERGVLEVDCPILSHGASVDVHIDLIPAQYGENETVYLHSSPEFGMKRLLAEGIGDIYQLSHVFRNEECGPKHNPEFLLAEWYRQGISLSQMIEETADFIRLFLGPLPLRSISYRCLFVQELGVDPFLASCQELFSCLLDHHIPVYPEILSEGKDALCNLLLGTCLEPLLGKEELTVLTHYPASQAALAKKIWLDGAEVAERFEIYFSGTELANGYHELTDPIEQRHRFIAANAERERLGKPRLPLDEFFLTALAKGLPDCCGVAVGVDRLLMLRHKMSSLEEVLSFSWVSA